MNKVDNLEKKELFTYKILCFLYDLVWLFTRSPLFADTNSPKKLAPHSIRKKNLISFINPEEASEQDETILNRMGQHLMTIGYTTVFIFVAAVGVAGIVLFDYIGLANPDHYWAFLSPAFIIVPITMTSGNYLLIKEHSIKRKGKQVRITWKGLSGVLLLSFLISLWMFLMMYFRIVGILE